MPAVLLLCLETLLVWFSRLMMIKLGVWIVGALVYLGIYFGTQNFLVDPLVDQIIQLAQNTATGPMIVWIKFLCIDKAITMICSAYTAAGSIAAVKTALFKRT